MIDQLCGDKRRYHIESVLFEGQLGIVYRAFSRRRVGQTLKRHYYAIIEQNNDAAPTDFYGAVKNTLLTSSEPIYQEESFKRDGHTYVVLAKGVARQEVNPKWKKLYNRGYLMLFLSAFILVLLIIRFSQKSAEDVQPVVDDSIAIESVDL